MDKSFFIRPYREVDQEHILRIWYSESLRSHPFIPARFWEGHLETLRNRYLPESETFVAERDGRLVGFISLIGNYIGAFFVDVLHQGQGIGSALMEYAHKSKGSLFVDVYKENTHARSFYEQYGFTQKREKIQHETGHTMITMHIEKNSGE